MCFGFVCGLCLYWVVVWCVYCLWLVLGLIVYSSVEGCGDLLGEVSGWNGVLIVFVESIS